MDLQLRVLGLLDHDGRLPVEAEPGNDEFVVAPAGMNDVLHLLGRDRAVLRAEGDGDVVRLAGIRALPDALGVEGRAGLLLEQGVHTFKFAELVVREGDAVLADEVRHPGEIGAQVLDVVPNVPLPFVRRAVEQALLAHREFLRADALYRERAGDADDVSDDLRLIHQLLLLRIGLDAGIDLIHLRSPCLAVGRDRILQGLRPVGIGVEGDFPVLPLPALLRETPAPAVGVRDGAFAFALLLLHELQAELVANGVRDLRQSPVAGHQRRVEYGFVFGKDRVEVLVLGDALQSDMRNGLVHEIARRPSVLIS